MPLNHQSPHNEPTWVSHSGRLVTRNTAWWSKHMPDSNLSCKHKITLDKPCKMCQLEMADGA